MGIFTLDREGLDRGEHDDGRTATANAPADAAPASPSDAAAVLARARARVEPALREAVDALPESMRRIAAYHFGWRNADGTPSGADGGKAIRPALVLAAAEALGGEWRAAVPAAAAVELVHNFTLVHDDVIDHDPTRRHKPTAWTVFGVADAILAGDAMQSLALRVLARDAHPAAGRAADRLASCVIELCDGQHADCSFERRGDVGLEECLAMAEAKTGALLGCACALGALYAGAGEAEADAMDAFGRQVGLAFQLIDDLIGIWGDPDVTGKPVGADLTARKKSLPVVAALRSGTPAGERLAELYAGQQPLSEVELALAAEAIEEAGGRAWAQAEACDRMAAAIGHLADALPDGAGTEDLLALAELVTRRDH